MQNTIDRTYYNKRIVEERTRAGSALDWAAAAAHREMAELYEQLIAAEDKAMSSHASS